jgi:Oxidoreductase family, NAD-binding Rossmann fold
MAYERSAAICVICGPFSTVQRFPTIKSPQVCDELHNRMGVHDRALGVLDPAHKRRSRSNSATVRSRHWAPIEICLSTCASSPRRTRPTPDLAKDGKFVRAPQGVRDYKKHHPPASQAKPVESSHRERSGSDECRCIGRYDTGWLGGGPGAFIGAVHRKAAALDGEIDLVAGAFSHDAAKSRKQGEELFLDPKRVYASWKEMVEKEAKLPAGERIDFVSIVTPNASHFEIARTFLEAGFHVVCDKPMTTTVEDAEQLCKLAARHKAVFALTHNYTGYPMVKQARELVRQGKLGSIRKLVVEYSQGWLAGASGINMWRLDPKLAGISSVTGDFGVRAWNFEAERDLLDPARRVHPLRRAT